MFNSLREFLLGDRRSITGSARLRTSGQRARGLKRGRTRRGAYLEREVLARKAAATRRGRRSR